MECETPLYYMKEYIKDKIKSFIHEPSDYKELVISWMTIKTIQADKGNYLINLWNDRAISAFLNLEKNYIIPMVTILFSALTRMFPKPTFAP